MFEEVEVMTDDEDDLYGYEEVEVMTDAEDNLNHKDENESTTTCVSLEFEGECASWISRAA
jgi:hypothetical protein